MTIDPNNLPGGARLVLTAKTANKVQFFDAQTLARTGEIDMPASTSSLFTLFRRRTTPSTQSERSD